MMEMLGKALRRESSRIYVGGGTRKPFGRLKTCTIRAIRALKGEVEDSTEMRSAQCVFIELAPNPPIILDADRRKWGYLSRPLLTTSRLSGYTMHVCR